MKEAVVCSTCIVFNLNFFSVHYKIERSRGGSRKGSRRGRGGGVQNVGPGFVYTHAITLIQKWTERLSKFV